MAARFAVDYFKQQQGAVLPTILLPAVDHYFATTTYP